MVLRSLEHSVSEIAHFNFKKVDICCIFCQNSWNEASKLTPCRSQRMTNDYLQKKPHKRSYMTFQFSSTSRNSAKESKLWIISRSIKMHFWSACTVLSSVWQHKSIKFKSERKWQRKKLENQLRDEKHKVKQNDDSMLEVIFAMTCWERREFQWRWLIA